MKIYKRLSMLLSMGIMGIGLITFKFEPAAVADPKPDTVMLTPTEAPQPTPTATPTPAPTPTPIPNDLTEITGGDVFNLVVSYEKAKLECEREKFTGLVTDTSYINEDDLQFRYATVRDFEDFKCYSKRGAGNIDYIVYCIYRMDIATVETKGISIDRLFITSADDKPIVFVGYVEDDIQAALDEIHSDDDVQTLIGNTFEELQTEMEEDPDFCAYMTRLYTGSDIEDPSEEDTDIGDSSSEGSDIENPPEEGSDL